MESITKSKSSDRRTVFERLRRYQFSFELAALLGTLGVIIALTTLKAYFRIGYLWKPERQRVRQLELTPFDMIQHSKSTFAVVFETAGNIAFYIPLGLMLVIVFSHRYSGLKLIGIVTAIGLAVSITLESVQYIFALGRTDIDDLWCNTLGTLIGAAIAVLFGKRWYPLWTILGLLSTTVFIILVLLGERLGDPAAIVE